jgi:hypothetical protein
MAKPRPTHDEVRDREIDLLTLDGRVCEDRMHMVHADRAARYAAIAAEMTVPDSLVAWAAHMAQMFGPTARIWKNDVNWIIALLIVRYGESEHHWPHRFDAEDVKRAWKWASLKDVPGAWQPGTRPVATAIVAGEQRGTRPVATALVAGEQPGTRPVTGES